MTRDRAKKKAIRARMAANGEPYSVAARRLDAGPAASAESPAGDALVAEVIAAVTATLAAPSARFSYQRDFETKAPPRQRPRPGPVRRLVGRAAGAAWKRIAPSVDAAEAREELLAAFAHMSGVGIMEPAAGRYQIDYGAYAQLYVDGELFGGLPGTPPRPHGHSRGPQRSDPLEELRMLLDVKQARQAREETLRGTPCLVIAVRAGSGERTLWIDDEHVRRIQADWRDRRDRGSSVTAFELWDFGVPADSLDWSRLPRFKETG